MGQNKKHLVANGAQALLWLWAFLEIYLLVGHGGSPYRDGLDIASSFIFLVLLIAVAVMIHQNMASGLVLKKSGVRLGLRKSSQKRGGDIKEDEFMKDINQKSGATSFKIVEVFLMSATLFAILVAIKDYGSLHYLVTSGSALIPNLLIVLAVFTIVTSPIQLYKINPRSSGGGGTKFTGHRA